jgi:crotonobetainyl-CoA:carnitine CoA-transferase CaiB-like acyl-CoA transferase
MVHRGLASEDITGPLSGVRIVEVASHVFVPIAGGVLSEWGADVIKIEHPTTGDPYRGLRGPATLRLPGDADPSFHSANRGKRSVGLDLKEPRGRKLLGRLIESADVFLTNVRGDARRRLDIDLDGVRADNPSIIYVRGTGFGVRGPDAGKGGYDSGAYWARTGMQYAMTEADMEWPAVPHPAFGDVMGGITLAGAISTALYRRATTGEPSVVDVSLLGTGMWQLQVELVNACMAPDAPRLTFDRYELPNPLMLPYRTSDGRFIALQLLTPDRFWPDLCQIIGEPEMAGDPRFIDFDARAENSRACVEWLDNVFAKHDYDEWRRILADFPGEWIAVVSPAETVADPQVGANGYIAQVDVGDVVPLHMITAPAQFDEQPSRPRRGPEHGEHTEDVLLELGLSWEEIADLKDGSVIV